MPTLYVNNLNDKVSIPKLKEKLLHLFSQYGDVLQVTAHGNLKMKGQAFITYDLESAAKKAQEFLQEYSLFGKPMKIQTARLELDGFHEKQGNADAIAKRKQQKAARRDSEPKPEPPRKKRKLNNPPSAKLLLQNVDNAEDDHVLKIVTALAGYASHKVIKARKVVIIEFSLESDATNAMESVVTRFGDEAIVDYGK